MGQQYSSEQPQVPEDNDDNFMVATEQDNGEISSDPNPQSFHEFECTCRNGEGGSARTCAACNRLSGSLSQNHHGKQQQQRQQEQQDETSSIESIGDEEREDYFVKSSTRHHVLNLSNRSLSRLTPSIANLHNLTRINLSNNQLVTLPRELGYLDNLRSLDISGNRLVALPGSISMLTRLKALNISRNQLKTLPSSMGTMPRLMIIIAHSNGFTHLPVELGRMPCLASLNISQNPLRVLPAELVMNPSLRKLVAEDCAFEVDDGHVDNLVHDPPSLLEICARQIVRSKIVVRNLPEKLRAYFDRVQWCSFCKGPFFDACIKRTRYIERVTGQHILIEYRLCSAHWVTEDERILNMFASQELYEPRHITVIDNYGNSNGYMLEASSPPAFPSSSRTCSSLKSSSASSPAPPSSYTLHVHSAMIQLH